MKPDTGDGYTIEDARNFLRVAADMMAGKFGTLQSPEGTTAVVNLAALAIREHERAEAAERRASLTGRWLAELELDADELEARAVRAEAAVAHTVLGPVHEPEALRDYRRGLLDSAGPDTVGWL